MNPPPNPNEPVTQARTPSGIVERQNEPKNLQLLAAQRQLYSEEKIRTGSWYVVSLAIAILATGALTLVKSYEPLITLLVLLVAAGELVLLPRLREPRSIAATIQELFDCQVLDQEWNDALAETPDPKAVERAVERFDKRKNREQEWKDLDNWYETPAIQTLPILQARIACLKENVRWDSGQRREWVWWVAGIAGGVVVLLAVVGILSDWLLKQYFSGSFLLTVPLIVAVSSHVARHLEAANRLDHLAGVIEDLRRDALREPVDDAKITRRTRYLQTEMCRHRMEDVPVLDWFYRKLGRKYAPARADGAPTAQQ